ncbi:hypothetical protein KB206_10790 [Microvirga sp. STS02]|uniref:hypothetical protein n=1 Tax=Hymenobacter negativus TaxID=2795026 RepID=UPI0018DC7384|nr:MULTISPECIES: hypothetical protein [Bacteria]MBH8569373.1 hypothetical protein [Hymenobacter negativus]MBR7209107.1 hypothetical protein [Microvirga sp. STS02]
MPNYQIKREDLKLGTLIVSTAEPSIGKVYKLVFIQPIGYDNSRGRYVHFTEYDFVEVEKKVMRRGFTLNYINRYFALRA